MNLLSLSRKECMSWQPFATSTPLKAIPDNLKSIDLPPKQLLKPSDAINALLNGNFNCSPNHQYVVINEQKPPKCDKKVKKNRSSFFFDVSPTSSTEDEDFDDDNNHKPILEIKIQSKNTTTTKSIMKNKNVDDNGDKKKDDSKCTVNKNKAPKKITRNLKSNNFTELNLKNSSFVEKNQESGNKILNPSSKEICAGKKKASGQICTITSLKKNKGCVKSVMKENNCNFVFKEAINEHLKENIGKFKISQVENGCLQNINNKSEKSVNDDQVDENASKEIYIDHHKSKIKQFKVSSNKRKACKGAIAVSPVRNIKKKAKILAKKHSDSMEKIHNQSVSLLHIEKDRNNSSHQLFSDSVEQELINSLDLTKEDVEEQVHSVEPSSKMKLKKSLSAAKFKSQQNQESCVKKSSRQKKPPKQFWISETTRSEFNISTKILNTEKLLKRKVKEIQPTTTSKDVNTKPTQECILKNDKIIDTEFCSVSKKIDEKIVDDIVIKDDENYKVNFKVPVVQTKRKSLKSTGEKRQLRSNKIIPNLDENEKENVEAAEQKENRTDLQDNTNSKDIVLPNKQDLPDNSDSVFFKSLNQLQFSEGSHPGYLTSECWSLKNFKCGVLKVKFGSQIISNTAFDSSYFGGVIVKGRLKMKVGKNELSLQEGDTVFVPPLTEWSAFNTSKSEAVFYYWCGRFKT